MQLNTVDDWWQSPLGRYLLAREQVMFDAAVSDVFGFHAVQLELPLLDALRTNRMPNRLRLGACIADVRCDPVALPLASASIDLLILPHVLDFSSHPHQVLREAERVLVPEGRLMITGFNPWSVWGLERQLHRRRGYPWCGNFIGLPRLRDWLALMNLDVSVDRVGCSVPSSRSPQWWQRLRLLEQIGCRRGPVGGGVYFLQAVKRVRGVRMLTPAWPITSAPKRLVTSTDRVAVESGRTEKRHQAAEE